MRIDLIELSVIVLSAFIHVFVGFLNGLSDCKESWAYLNKCGYWEQIAVDRQQTESIEEVRVQIPEVRYSVER